MHTIFKGVRMLLGSMNNPKENLFEEITRITDMGFDFIDLTLEYPGALPEVLMQQKKDVLDALSTSKLKVVGHCPWFLSLAHPYDSVRDASIKELKECIRAAAVFGADKVGIHPDTRATLYDSRGTYLSRLATAVMELNKEANDNGMVLLMEPYTDDFLNADELAQLFHAASSARLTLDIGHANIILPESKGIDLMLDKFKHKLYHMHLSDNHGEKDEHIGLGKGAIDWEKTIKKIKSVGYDGTITLEVFSGKADLEGSKLIARELWQKF